MSSGMFFGLSVYSPVLVSRASRSVVADRTTRTPTAVCASASISARRSRWTNAAIVGVVGAERRCDRFLRSSFVSLHQSHVKTTDTNSVISKCNVGLKVQFCCFGVDGAASHSPAGTLHIHCNSLGPVLTPSGVNCLLNPCSPMREDRCSLGRGQEDSQLTVQGLLTNPGS